MLTYASDESYCRKVRRAPVGPLFDGTPRSTDRMSVTSSPAVVAILHPHLGPIVRQLSDVLLRPRQAVVLRQRHRSTVSTRRLPGIRLPRARSARYQTPAVRR